MEMLEKPAQTPSESVPTAVIDEHVDGRVHDDEQVADTRQNGHGQRRVQFTQLLAILVMAVHSVPLGENLVKLNTEMTTKTTLRTLTTKLLSHVARGLKFKGVGRRMSCIFF